VDWYLDTSVLVAALTREARTAAAQRWLADQAPGCLFISEWVTTEFSAALSMKMRMRHLGGAMRADALSVFTTLSRDTFSVLDVTSEDFHTAAQLADQHASGLRAGDALHVSIAGHHGMRIISLDRTLVKAALAAGISAQLF
jgi:predicted nucleic acid-binding protein